MPSIVKQPLFISAFGLYLVTLADKYFQLHFPPFFKNYLADFLCLPIVLSLTLSLLRKIKKQPNLHLSALHILVAVIYVSIFFEWILPLSSSRYTSDLFDVIAYFLGGILFYKTQN